MDIVELEQIEKEAGVSFSLSEVGRISAKGQAAAVARALARIVPFRAQTAVLLRERQGIPDPDATIITREISPNVQALAMQREKYLSWLSAKSEYFQPSADELDKMFSALEEGDEILPDFAHSFTVRKPDGRLISVDRKGRCGEPSMYSPALKVK